MTTRPAPDTDEELIWLRGYEAGVQQMREDARSLPAAIDTVVAEVEKLEAQGKWSWKVDDDGKVIWSSQFAALLRALRTEASSEAPTREPEG